jgi:BirA family biotin operon repressor/biotin-[acetyl-CoA-carboxylase] ligase
LAVYTRNPRYAGKVLPEEVVRRLAPVDGSRQGVRPLLDSIFSGGGTLLGTAWDDLRFDLLVTEFSPHSQYDKLIELARDPPGLPDRVACLAGSGRDFHGFKGRSWAAVPGNLHLAVHLAPNRPIEGFEVAFTALAALSVVEAIDELDGLSSRPMIKWVNDILMGDAKVAGILAYTQSRDTTVSSAVLGFGLNVESTPLVEPTLFVPAVASLRDFLPEGAPDAQARVLQALLLALDRNYDTLLAEGATSLVERYRERSKVVGEEVTICTETSDKTLRLVDRGRVMGLGDRLELILDGRAAPITGGRLIMGSIELEMEGWNRSSRATSGARPIPNGCIHA